jgi:acyl carrier protein
MSDLETRVIELISEKLKIPEDEISMISSFTDDFKTSSLDLVDLIMNFEEEFEIEIPDEDAAKIVTVEDAMTYLRDRVEE